MIWACCYGTPPGEGAERETRHFFETSVLRAKKTCVRLRRRWKKQGYSDVESFVVHGEDRQLTSRDKAKLYSLITSPEGPDELFGLSLMYFAPRGHWGRPRVVGGTDAGQERARNIFMSLDMQGAHYNRQDDECYRRENTPAETLFGDLRDV